MITMLPMVLFWTTSTMAEVRLTGRSITTRDGLPSNRINDMIQDKTGYIWLGTSNGLCRYDGYSFMNLQTLGNGHDHTIGNVGTIHLDEKNNLMWIRTATFNYACYDLQRGSFTNYYGACDPHKTFERFIAEEDGIWMYEARAGIRHVTYRNG
jgi:ligand-binding sensor domain-containing protein